MIVIDVKPISELQENLPTYLELFQASQTPAFFTHPLYLVSWWKHLGKGEGKLITITRDSALIGYIALFREEASPSWRLIGAKDESDYLDLVCKSENTESIWVALLQYWQENKTEWTQILLECIPNTTQTKELLKNKSAEFGFTATATQQDVAPIIPLPSSYEEYLEKIDPNLKKRIRRFTQAIQEDDMLSFKTLTDPEAIKNIMPAFITLHKASGNEKAAFWTPKREAFFLETLVLMAEQDFVKLETLEVSGDPAAMVISFIYQNRLLGYNSGFNQYRYGHLGVGTVLAAHSIEAAIKAGYTHYDFMRGNEPYKFEFGAVAEPVWDIALS